MGRWASALYVDTEELLGAVRPGERVRSRAIPRRTATIVPVR